MSSKRKIVTNLLITIAFVLLPQFVFAQTNTFPTTGNAGVGTTSPGDALHIVKDNGGLTLDTATSGTIVPVFRFSTTGTGRASIQYRPDLPGLAFQTGGIAYPAQSRMVLTDAGNVGIGTTTPGFGGITSSTYLTLAASGSNRPAFEFVSNLSDGVGKEAGFLEFVFNTNSAGHKRIGNISVDTEGATANQRGGVMRLFTKPNGSATMLERMRIDSAGNIGIGTTAPSEMLHVGGGFISTIRNEMSTWLSQNVAGGETDWSNNAYYSSGWKYRLADEASQIQQLNGDIRFFTAGSGTAGGGVTFSEKLTVLQGGNVGVGVVTPTYKLDVNGEINATGIRINGTPISGGGGSQWSGTSSIYYNGGNVGIGTTSPDNPLTVKASGSSTQGFAVKNNALTQYLTYIGPRGSGGTAQNQGFLAILDQGTSTVVLDSAGPSYFTGGNVGIGNSSPTEKLHVTGNITVAGTGNITAAGTIEGGNIKAKYQDLAEWVPSSEQLSAGTVVVLDTTKSNQVISSTQSYDTRVAGVISAQPGITLGEEGEGKVLVATTGRVRVKVDTSRGAIQIGDLLVTSNVPGLAMKSEPVEFAGRKMHMPGTIIGKALEPLAKGSGEILVLLSLQ